MLLGSFATAYYIFRVFFIAFHTEERMDKHIRQHLHEPSWTMTLPLILLAIPSAILGISIVYKMLFSAAPLLNHSVTVASQYDVLHDMAEEFPGVFNSIWQSFIHLPVWFSISGIFMAWFTCVRMPTIRDVLAKRLSLFRFILMQNMVLIVLINMWSCHWCE